MSNESELFEPTNQTVMDAPVEQQPNALMQVIQAEHIEAGSAVEIRDGFSPFFAEADEWRVKAMAIKVTDISQKADMAMARVIRLKLKEIRVQANKKREALKENSLRYGKAVQGAYNILEYLIVPLEKSLEEAEKFAEVQEAKRQSELKTSREIQLAPWQQFVPFGLNLGTMTEDDFSKVLAGAKLQHHAKIDAEEKAEAERQRIREENERLRIENEAKEKALAEERAKAEAERVASEKAAAKLKAENDARLEVERQAAERLAAKAKAEADAKLAAERSEREKLEAANRARLQAESDEKERQRIESEKALSASDDVKLEAFAKVIESLAYPVVTSDKAIISLDLARYQIENVAKDIRDRIGK